MDRPNRCDHRPDELFDHFPPHDLAAERAVLAVLLLDPGRIAQVAAALEPADFGNQVNRAIYKAMLHLHSAGNPIDVTLLVGELRDSGQYNAEGGVSAATLVELFRPAPLIRELPQYLSHALEMSRQCCARA